MYVYYQGSDGSIRSLGDSELAHYNHNHDALGRFARGNGGSSTYESKMRSLDKATNKINKKTQSLRSKEVKYRAKAAKYQRKANKVKRLAANPLIGLTDANRGANYAALRFEGKGLKYVEKAEKANKKIDKLEKKNTKLVEEKIKLAEEKSVKEINDTYTFTGYTAKDAVKHDKPHKLSANISDEFGEIDGKMTSKQLTSPSFGRIHDSGKKYATDELYTHYKEHPEFYRADNNLTKDQFGKHVILDQVNYSPHDNKYHLWYIDDFGDYSYPDNTWYVVYDNKEKKIDKRNSQYYR